MALVQRWVRPSHRNSVGNERLKACRRGQDLSQRVAQLNHLLVACDKPRTIRCGAAAAPEQALRSGLLVLAVDENKLAHVVHRLSREGCGEDGNCA